MMGSVLFLLLLVEDFGQFVIGDAGSPPGVAHVGSADVGRPVLVILTAVVLGLHVQTCRNVYILLGSDGTLARVLGTPGRLAVVFGHFCFN